VQTTTIIMKKTIKILAFILSLGFLTFPLSEAQQTSSPPKVSSTTIKVAVLDTGFDFKSKWKKAGSGLVRPKLCPKGHKDFTKSGTIYDNHGHGTHVAGIIAQLSKDIDYCIIVVKTYRKGLYGPEQVRATVEAFNYVTSLGVDIINYSAGGTEFFYPEYVAVKRALDQGIVVVAAAGNESTKVDSHVISAKTLYQYTADNGYTVYKSKINYMNKHLFKIQDEAVGYYPASYDPRIIAVMNYDLIEERKLQRDGRSVVKKRYERHETSNYGAAFSFFEDGTEVLSILPNNQAGYMTGTSQATPKVTAKIIRNWKK